MGGQQVDRPRLAHLVLGVFGHQQEEGGKGHDLPGYEQQGAVAGHHHHCHGAGKEPVEKGDAGRRGLVPGGGPVTETVERAAQGDEKDRQQEKCGQRVDPDLTDAEGEGPVDDIADMPLAHEHQDRRAETERGGGTVIAAASFWPNAAA
jgi:hypothetical protein